MADLEQHAIKRDKRFLVRLILALLVGAIGGAFLYSKITSPETGTCAARLMGQGDGAAPNGDE